MILVLFGGAAWREKPAWAGAAWGEGPAQSGEVLASHLARQAQLNTPLSSAAGGLPAHTPEPELGRASQEERGGDFRRGWERRDTQRSAKVWFG